MNRLFVLAHRLTGAEHAAAAVEYALLLGLLAMTCLVATRAMAFSISEMLAFLSDQLREPPGN